MPATMPATREKAVASEIVERSSDNCTRAEGELLMDLGEWKAEGDLMETSGFHVQPRGCSRS